MDTSFFLQLESGYDSLHRYLRGVTTAIFGLLGFFLSTALLFPYLPIFLIFLCHSPVLQPWLWHC